VSKWIIMQTVDGITIPVAIRNDEKAALERCRELAFEQARRPASISSTQMGTVVVRQDASFMALEVEDVE
jgi:hypothetical protein